MLARLVRGGRAEARAGELERVNGELEERVRERTQELQQSHDQLIKTTNDLARTLSALEEAKRRLEQEMADKERIEGELRLAHRLEAVGQLAAGVAHEINTPIQYVGDSLYFLKQAFEDLTPLLAELPRAAALLEEAGETELAAKLTRGVEEADLDFVLEQAPKALERAHDGVDRVARIVRAMKAFAHPGADEARPEDLNAALTNTLVVAKNEYKYVADVETTLGDLPPITCRLGEMNQVFLNLLVNAAHAIADVVADGDQRGKICLRSRLDGAFAVFEIEDTGGGIPEEIRQKIFDPFFTTKPVGRGTGQGLTIARSIVVKHGGCLSFKTEEGKGTTFVVRLPLAPEGAAACPD